MSVIEANLEGLVGLTHNYAGLSFGNIASEKYAHTPSRPKAAAMQGLNKMKFLHDRGIAQLVMPPQPRFDRALLQNLGFASLADVPDALLGILFSASSMWTANAATVSPSADTRDSTLHMTPANLISKLHRSLEPGVAAQYLRQIFPGPLFTHHAPLPPHVLFADEGAANQMRLSHDQAEPLEIFVYGGVSQRFPARQSRLASEALIRLHGVKHAILAEQNPRAIDAGVFHNDVIAMSHDSLVIHHEYAFCEPLILPDPYRAITIRETDLPLEVAVASYFFNSQLVSLPEGGVLVVAPSECEEHTRAKAAFDRLLDAGIVAEVHYLNLRESMKNGGGPACLRLRVTLNEREREAVHKSVWLNDNLYRQLCGWIEKHYRDIIVPDDLRDPHLAEESERALAELSGMIHINMGAA